VGDERAAVGDGANQVLAPETLKCLANGSPADLQLFAQAGLIDDRTGRHLQAHDPFEDACVGLLALRSCRDGFSDRHPYPSPLPGRYATDIPARNVAPDGGRVNW